MLYASFLRTSIEASSASTALSTSCDAPSITANRSRPVCASANGSLENTAKFGTAGKVDVYWFFTYT